MSFLDPEALALLREVEATRGSALFRVRPEEVRDSLWGNVAYLRQSATSLSKLERHLLELYRNDLAFALRELAKLRLYTDPQLPIRLHRTVTVNQELHIPTKKELQARARALRESSVQDDSLQEEFKLLSNCVQGFSEKDASVAEIAVASLRLAPSDTARICVALDLFCRGHTRGALAGLHNVCAFSSSALLVSYACENLGFVHSMNHNLERAIEAYEQAVTAHEERITPVLSLFMLFIQVGKEPDAIRAAKLVEALVKPGHFALRGCVDRKTHTKRLGRWCPTEVMRTLVARIENQIGPAARSVLEIYHA